MSARPARTVRAAARGGRFPHGAFREMSERTDDTTEGAAGSRPERERAPGSYYYDDATGYEVYLPEEGEDAPADDAGPEE